MKRPWQIWLTFGACVAVVVAAVAWLTLRTLELERAEALARRQAALEENVRLALWRMDSAVAPLIIRESARPPQEYNDLLMSLIPRPPGGLPEADTANVLRYFEVHPGGALSCPVRLNGRVADPFDRGSRFEDSEPFATTDELDALVAALPEPPTRLPAQDAALPNAPWGDQTAQQSLDDNDYQVRSQLILNSNTILQQQAQQYAAPQFLQLKASPKGAPPPVAEPADGSSPDPLAPEGVAPEAAPTRAGTMVPLWHNGQLLLMRRVVEGPGQWAQGCVLDWPTIRNDLLHVAGDLLPEARLDAVVHDDDDPAHRLANLPVRIIPGKLSAATANVDSPVYLSLAVTWGSLLAAVAAAALVLRGVLALSERRAAFVSAVTHELRTPLTTFRLYSEMLAEDMVPADSRQRYLTTLQGEADRLMHLVENVLSYARLEKNPTGIRTEPVRVADLLEPMRGRLTERATRGNLELVLDADDSALAACVTANPSSVEQILLNLVDNACKYAAGADDRRLHLDVVADSAAVQLRLRDHGPGVPRAAQRRLFRPFHKSASEAAQSAPGVGLGLAFSRRLARAMRGDLHLDRTPSPGAAFVLTLSRSRRGTA